MNDCVTMSSLGKNGRFGNQIFQYAFIRYYARRYGIRFQVPRWQGQEIFGTQDPPLSEQLPKFEVGSRAELEKACCAGPVVHADFWGYFQEIEYFFEDKNFFCELFSPVEKVSNYLQDSWASLKDKDVIGLHLRYGDYGYSYFFETPLQWVVRELEKRWDTYKAPILYLATDDARVRCALKQFSPVLCSDVFPNAHANGCPEFYADFWALSQVNALLLTANSSFSFAAAMLNRGCLEMMRPSLLQHGFVNFDPWGSPVLLKDVTPRLKFLENHMRFSRYYNKIKRLVLFALGSKLRLYF